MKFPLIEAFLICPTTEGKIGICTNTQAPGMVINEIPEHQRTDIAALGSLVVNRDGTERMIVNALSHPKLEYIILFGEETISFRPSTNLLNALMHGYDANKNGNIIINGQGIAHQYPSIPTKLLEQFKQRIKIIPMFKHSDSHEIVKQYLNWLKQKVPQQVYDCLTKIHAKDKMYYDSLLELIDTIKQQPSQNEKPLQLDPKDFQHLQPPIIQVVETTQKSTVPFEITNNKGQINAKIDFDNNFAEFEGNDSFLLAYTIMQHMNKNNFKLTPEQQLLLGTELSRIEIEIKNNITTEPFVNSEIKNTQRTKIPTETRTLLKADKKYYYKIAIKDEQISVQSMAHDTCETVYDLRNTKLLPIIQRIAKENRFETYEQETLHRLDVGIETGRASIALTKGQSYFQDFRNLFTINTTHHPLFVVDADTFLAGHQKIITNLYTRGLTEQHPDTHKGTMRQATVLAIYRNKPFQTFPAIYATGTQTTTEMREQYKQQLLSTENKGAYTYGNRTRQHFGKDQLNEAIEHLRKHPDKPFVIQRFDYNLDMTIHGKEATHDPCLTHDIYFIQNGKLQSLHIARAHNIVNAYPENIYGLHDAYDSTIANALGIETGDLYMLSSRANILLLTEEQKAKKLIAEPSKPTEEQDKTTGPHTLEDDKKGIAYAELQMTEVNTTTHPELVKLQNYNEDLIQKAINYYKKRAPNHNNPIIGTINPRQYDATNRLVFFQCNKAAGHLQTTAVFLDQNEKDIELCNYITTQYSKQLNIPLGKLFLFTVRS